MRKKAIIISIKGFNLTHKEKLLLKERPWGLILFKRNIESFSQIKSLVQKIKKLTKDKNFPILIDEEGATVSRLSNIINHSLYAKFFGNLYSINNKAGIRIYKKYLNSLCKNLRSIGVNINTIPVLDVLRKNTSKVIGNRSFSNNKEIVKKMGNITIKACHANKIISVVKHIPGHGCSKSDSHFVTPKVNINFKEFNSIDIYPFTCLYG